MTGKELKQIKEVVMKFNNLRSDDQSRLVRNSMLWQAYTKFGVGWLFLQKFYEVVSIDAYGIDWNIHEFTVRFSDGKKRTFLL